jgi:mannosyltransferase OCH1-like enzyme
MRVRMWKPRKEITYSKSGIPKIIHQIWIGKKTPPVLSKYMSTFKNMNGYIYKLWRNEDLSEANFPKTWKYINKLLNSPKIFYAMIADLMRLEILYHHGGIYVDTSFEAVKNLDVILDKYDSSQFIMSNEASCGLKCRGGDKKQLYISNSFIISTPFYKVIERLISEEYLSNIDFSQKANYSTGPYYVRTGIIKKSDVTMLETSLIYPYNYEDEENDQLFDECFSTKKKRDLENINILIKNITLNFHVKLI